MKDDLARDNLYESVKTLIDHEKDQKGHFHLHQHKLYTLFSIGFNYLLFNSTKEPGTYIIRVEGSILAEKLAKKSKDAASRNFLESLLIPKKLIYKGSTFYLDFFQIGSWNRTKDLPKEKIKEWGPMFLSYLVYVYNTMYKKKNYLESIRKKN